MSQYQVTLENIFSGPLDLLLYLVRKDEVDIYDIPISNITKQYIQYVEMIKSFDLDLAGDFIVMAATLMEIKSAMLLPKTNPDQQDDEGSSDPRNELIRQLLEYKRFKDAASILEFKAGNQMHRYPRPDSYIKQISPDQEPQLDIEQVSIWTLLETFDSLMKATGRYQDYSRIQDDTPIDVYEIEILDRLQTEGPLTFEHIFDGRNNRLAIVGLFLAMLELIRDKLIWAEQSETTNTIYLRALTDVPAEMAVQNAIIASENDSDSLDIDLKQDNIGEANMRKEEDFDDEFDLDYDDQDDDIDIDNDFDDDLDGDLDNFDNDDDYQEQWDDDFLEDDDNNK